MDVRHISALEVAVSAPDEETCANTLREIRWPHGVVKCVKCNSIKVNRDGKSGPFRKYWCKSCGTYFNDRSRTIFQDTKVPLSKWFRMSLLLGIGTSIAKISRDVGISYRNTYYLVKKLRGSAYPKRIAESLSAQVGASEKARADATDLPEAEQRILRVI